MARKPMSEEQRKAQSERMKARHAAKKAEHAVQETSHVGQVKSKDYSDHLASVQEAYETIGVIRQEYPDMIEAVRAKDALEKAVHFMGQVNAILVAEQQTKNE